MIKIYAIVLVILISIASPSKSQWFEQNSGVSSDLKSIKFVSSTFGWAVGMNGVILNSNNGGGSWTPQTINTTYEIVDVDFVDSTNGWVVGPQNDVNFKTSNGGQDWIKTNVVSNWPNPSYLSGVDFSDTAHGVSFGFFNISSQSFKTSNGGISWVDWSIPMTYINDVDLLDSSRCMVVGFNSFNSTIDGGNSWTINDSVILSGGGDIDFINKDIGWIAGSNGMIVKTIDGGLNWVTQNSGTTQNITDICFADSLHGWAVGEGGLILHTRNGGISWLLEVSGTTVDLTSITASDSVNAWITGKGGLILHNSLILATYDPQDISSLAVYPNPLNKEATISFNLKNSQSVEISIEDCTGNKTIIFEGFLLPGEHKINLNEEILLPGVYYLRYLSDTVCEVKKIVASD
jgi:photosystem II stability/assembly factor-like uncharacterized protein